MVSAWLRGGGLMPYTNYYPTDPVVAALTDRRVKIRGGRHTHRSYAYSRTNEMAVDCSGTCVSKDQCATFGRDFFTVTSQYQATITVQEPSLPYSPWWQDYGFSERREAYVRRSITMSGTSTSPDMMRWELGWRA